MYILENVEHCRGERERVAMNGVCEAIDEIAYGGREDGAGDGSCFRT